MLPDLADPLVVCGCGPRNPGSRHIEPHFCALAQVVEPGMGFYLFIHILHKAWHLGWR